MKRWCRGKWKLSEADRRELHTKWQEVRATNNVADALAFKTALEMALSAGCAEPVGDVTWNFIELRVAGLIYSCEENCGFDVNNLICAFPLDGVEREVVCPECRQQTHTFSVYYELED